MKVGSLFSGYDGIFLGLREIWPEASLAWVCEFDQAPSRVLAHHHPDVVNHGDITTVDWATVEPVDVLTGGFPCQDLSHAGKRLGLRPGTRSGLWEHMAYAIDRLRPPLVVIENVRGLLSADAHSDLEPCPWCLGDSGDGQSPLRALGAVLGDLADLGYDAEWGGVRAADAGAPHGRFRVFIVAHPHRVGQQFIGGAVPGGATGVRPVAGPPAHPADAHVTGLEGRPADGRGAGEQPARSDGVGPEPLVRVGAQAPQPVALGAEVGPEVAGVGVDEGVDGGESLGFGGHGSTVPVLAADLSSPPLLPTPKASDGPNGGPGMRNGRGEADALPGVVALLPTPTSQAAKHGGTPDVNANGYGSNLWDLPHLDFGPYAPAIARWAAVLGRPAPSPTEPGRDGRPRLSPRFVEWLMGLPEGHVTAPEIGLTRAQALKVLGNGVVPAQCALALRMLLGLPTQGAGSAATLLPTPSAADGMGGHESRGGARGHERLLAGIAKDLTLLPTPEAHESGSTPESHLARKPGRTKVTALNIVVEHLLPTPAVNDMGEGKTPDDWDAWTEKMRAAHGNGNGHGKSLAIEAMRLGGGDELA